MDEVPGPTPTSIVVFVDLSGWVSRFGSGSAVGQSSACSPLSVDLSRPRCVWSLGRVSRDPPTVADAYRSVCSIGLECRGTTLKLYNSKLQ